MAPNMNAKTTGTRLASALDGWDVVIEALEIAGHDTTRRIDMEAMTYSLGVAPALRRLSRAIGDRQPTDGLIADVVIAVEGCPSIALGAGGAT